MTVVYLVTLTLLGAALAATLYRVARGPTMLDRAMAVDVVTSLAMCVVGAFAVARDDYSDLPILLVLSLLGFVGSVSLARFFAGRSPSGRPSPGGAGPGGAGPGGAGPGGAGPGGAGPGGAP